MSVVDPEGSQRRHARKNHSDLTVPATLVGLWAISFGTALTFILGRLMA